jgi:hypothetical protein
VGKDAIGSLVTVVTMIVVVAIVAVVVSKNADTAGVLSAGGQALANAIRAATAPVASSQVSSAVNTQLGQQGTLFPAIYQA